MVLVPEAQEAFDLPLSYMPAPHTYRFLGVIQVLGYVDAHVSVEARGPQASPPPAISSFPFFKQGFSVYPWMSWNSFVDQAGCKLKRAIHLPLPPHY